MGMCIYKPDPGHIAAALHSVFTQSCLPDELILVIDDCLHSTELLVETIAKQGHTSIDISVIKNAANLGIAKSRNKCISHCGSEYLLFLDQDDILYPYAFSIYSLFVSSASPAILYSTSDLLNNHAGTKTPYMSYLQGSIKPTLQNLIRACFFPLLTTLISTASIRESGVSFSSRYRSVEDYDFWLKLLPQLSADEIVFVPGPLGLYRVHDNNTSSDRLLYHSEHAKLYSSLLLDPHYSEFASELAALAAKHISAYNEIFTNKP